MIGDIPVSEAVFVHVNSVSVVPLSVVIEPMSSPLAFICSVLYSLPPYVAILTVIVLNPARSISGEVNSLPESSSQYEPLSVPVFVQPCSCSAS